MFSLTCLEIRSRNEEAINSTRNRIYSLKVFYFLLYRRRYLLSNQGPQFQINYISARDQKSDLHGMSFQSTPRTNLTLITRPFTYNESLQHPTIAVKNLLIKILIFFRPLSSIHLFLSCEWPRHRAGSFSNDDGDGNEDVKKGIGLLRKTTTLHVNQAFLYISLQSLHDYDVKMPNCKFYGGRKQATTNSFFSL